MKEESNYILNDNRLRIKKCCASCMYKRYTESDDFRECALTKEMVFPWQLCDSYMLKPELMKIGRSKGNAHKRHYIEYLNRAMNVPDTMECPRPTKEQLTEEYEKLYGSPYINL